MVRFVVETSGGSNLTGLGRLTATPTVARGPGGSLKLPQRVRAEPGRQTFLVHLLPENELWEAPKLSQQFRAEPSAKHTF